MKKSTKEDQSRSRYSIRRSLRKIGKYFNQNLSQFKILNPYKNAQPSHFIPHTLFIELARFEYLSIQSLQKIKIQKIIQEEEMRDVLSKMKVAVKMQSQKIHLAAYHARKDEQQDIHDENGEDQIANLQSILQVNNHQCAPTFIDGGLLLVHQRNNRQQEDNSFVSRGSAISQKFEFFHCTDKNFHLRDRGEDENLESFQM